MWAAIRLFRAMGLFGRIFASYMVQLGLTRLFGRARMRRRLGAIHRRNAKRLYKGFIRLRGVYIKLGQILSIMGNFLPRAYAEELERLQDEVPPTSFRSIKQAVHQSLGKAPTEAFATFNEKPLAAASLGQVHEATTREGDRVAVKVLYPNVATIIKVDLRVLGWALKVYQRFVPLQQLERVHEQLSDMLARETDYVNEARCVERMAKNFANDPDVLTPQVYPALSTDRVLTMSFMEGVKISKLGALEKLQLDPYAVATKLVQVFYKQLFFDKFFHADPHPGNFFVQRGPEGQVRLVILDLGSASEVPDNLVNGMLDILSGLMTRQDTLVVRGIEEMGFVAVDGDRELLERVTRTYFEKLLNLNITDFSRIDPSVAQSLADPNLKKEELRRLMKSISYPRGWFFVERAVVILFGLSSQLAPKLNTVQVGFPYIMKFMAENAGRRRPSAQTPVAQA
ncbi:MAG TPA: AarF/UbiB family protein [Kofleriaceae bacterium]|nr:AarF/UbiB family protein [Kofleriaceae bacterium]